MTFGEFLQELRVERGLKRSDMARMMGVQDVQMFQYERGGRIPKMPTLQHFAKVFEISPDTLFTLDYGEYRQEATKIRMKKGQVVRLDPAIVRVFAYRAGLTQVEIAKRIGMTKQAVNYAFSERDIRYSTAMAIAEVLGTTVEEIKEAE